MGESEQADRDRGRWITNAILWLAWVLGTSASATLGLAVANTTVLGLPDSAFVGDNGIVPLTYWACGLTLVMGPLIGLAQGLVLRFLAQMKEWLRWIGLTSLAVFLTEIVGTLLGVATAGSCAGLGWAVLPGFIIGYLQWLVLKREVQGAAWWIVGSGIAWIAGIAAGAIIFWSLLSQRTMESPFYPSESTMRWAVIWCAVTLVYAAVSGTVLLRLLSHREGVYA